MRFVLPSSRLKRVRQVGKSSTGSKHTSKNDAIYCLLSTKKKRTRNEHTENDCNVNPQGCPVVSPSVSLVLVSPHDEVVLHDVKHYVELAEQHDPAHSRAQQQQER